MEWVLGTEWGMERMGYTPVGFLTPPMTEHWLIGKLIVRYVLSTMRAPQLQHRG